ncbi:MAG: alpha-glucosidase C-terminal domain-containing protein, partial [Firmicutes bacterium]|nr:alpha-glucosidase C-terminal domain-containing protein [Bacillota bacterium]
SVLNFYRKVIAFRTQSDIVRNGDYKELMPMHPHLYVYERRWQGQTLLVICSFTEKACRFRFPKEFDPSKAQPVFCNYKNAPQADGRTLLTRPYEALVYKLY